MRILISCERSGIVRTEFEKLGADVYSCDIYESDIPSSKHIIGDVRKVLNDNWDMVIAFPPCTYLSRVNAKNWTKNASKQKEALDFVFLHLTSNIRYIALENPVGIISTKIIKPDQIINPYQFGEPYKKETCLWLKRLPKLIPTEIIDKNKCNSYIDYVSMSHPDRAKQRSQTFKGIAKAMAQQWLPFVIQDLQSLQAKNS